MHVRIILMLYNNIYLLLSEAINQSNCVQIFVLIKNYIVAGKFFLKKKKKINKLDQIKLNWTITYDIKSY